MSSRITLKLAHDLLSISLRAGQAYSQGMLNAGPPSTKPAQILNRPRINVSCLLGFYGYRVHLNIYLGVISHSVFAHPMDGQVSRISDLNVYCVACPLYDR